MRRISPFLLVCLTLIALTQAILLWHTMRRSGDRFDTITQQAAEAVQAAAAAGQRAGEAAAAATEAAKAARLAARRASVADELEARVADIEDLVW